MGVYLRVQFMVFLALVPSLWVEGAEISQHSVQLGLRVGELWA